LQINYTKKQVLEPVLFDLFLFYGLFILKQPLFVKNYGFMGKYNIKAAFILKGV